ncbi:WSC domain-containing protein [Xylariaceae sp. FL0804]|nr:WSC domain-containing protein [Xylariaceae sp. FL0804]
MVSCRLVAALVAAGLIQSAQAWYDEQPSCSSSFTPFTYAGCYDSSQSGALDFRSDIDQNSMTVELCTARCKGNGYRLAGLTYYGVCYCGEVTETALLDESQCSYPCSGNQNETCGSNSAMSIWSDPTFPPLASVLTSDYDYVGCWTDELDTKALFYYQQSLNNSAMTNEACLSACLGMGFPYAGTEFADQCYCGTYTTVGTALAANSSDCNTPCSGDGTETCGGAARLSLYYNKKLVSNQPCSNSPPGPPPTTTTTATTTAPSTTKSTSPYTTTTKSTTTRSTTQYTTTPYTTTPYTTTPYTTTPYTTTPYTTTTKPTKQPPNTTPPPPPAPPSSSASPSPSACTTAIVRAGRCEYAVGAWCCDAIHDWDSEDECHGAAYHGRSQYQDCLARAGRQHNRECDGFRDWCGRLDDYCSSSDNHDGQGGDRSRGGGKAGWFKHDPPRSGEPIRTETYTIPCPTSSGGSSGSLTHSRSTGSWHSHSTTGSWHSHDRSHTYTKTGAVAARDDAGWEPTVLPVTMPDATKTSHVFVTTPTWGVAIAPRDTDEPEPSSPLAVSVEAAQTSKAPPEPTGPGLCAQPSSYQYHYGPGEPVGGIFMPEVNCGGSGGFELQGSDQAYEHGGGKEDACADACRVQFRECLDAAKKSAGGGRGNRGKVQQQGEEKEEGGEMKKEEGMKEEPVEKKEEEKKEKRDGGGAVSAEDCMNQYHGCILANKRGVPDDDLCN